MKPINYTIALIATIYCLVTISNNDLYQDNPWLKAQWLGQDVVTLLIAIPVLLMSLKRGVGQHRIKWWMINTGMLLYFAYTFGIYVTSAKLTFLYFVQLLIFGLSVIGFIRSCMLLSHEQINFSLQSTIRKGIIMTYCIGIGLGLIFFWLTDSIQHITDPIYQSNTFDGQPPLINYTLDMGIIAPTMIASAIMLGWKERWGFILSGIILTKTSTLGFSLLAMATSMHLQHINPKPDIIILAMGIGVLGTYLTIFYLENLQMTQKAS